MLTQDVSLKDLPYREMETIILFHKDLIKAIPLVIISIPPFAIILVFTLMCLFPRQLLIHHLWTPQQQQDFQRLYHEQRCRHRENILKGVAWSIAHIKEWTLRSHLLTLISKFNLSCLVQLGCVCRMRGLIQMFVVQRGAHPSVKDINAVRLLCSHLLLNPWFTGFVLLRRLRAKALDLFYLDQALDTLGQGQLTDTEIRENQRPLYCCTT
ncbi:unnamed protein product [Coregonus sp. 'balchen']|nr:unnamed protein product [Coregonus sp. 'balchen']